MVSPIRAFSKSLADTVQGLLPEITLKMKSDKLLLCLVRWGW